MIETKIKNPTLMRLFYILIVLIIVFSAYRLKPVITGLFTIDDRFTYNRSVGLEFRENSNYTWTLEQPWNLKSIRLSGNYLPMSYTRVYIENNNLTYLIFDSSKSIGSLGDISSYVIEQKLSEAISPSLFESLARSLFSKSGKCAYCGISQPNALCNAIYLGTEEINSSPLMT